MLYYSLTALHYGYCKAKAKMKTDWDMDLWSLSNSTANSSVYNFNFVSKPNRIPNVFRTKGIWQESVAEASLYIGSKNII